MRMLKRLLLALLVVDVVVTVVAAVYTRRVKREHVNVGDERSDEFDFATIFEGLEFASRASALRAGAWITYFGGGTLDLSQAQLDPAGATLRLRALMGGGEITVPPNCRVELHSRFRGRRRQRRRRRARHAGRAHARRRCVVRVRRVRDRAGQRRALNSAGAWASTTPR